MKEKINENKILREKLTTISDDHFENSIDATIEWLQGLKDFYKDHTELYLENSLCYGYYGNNYTEYNLYGKRLETDSERDKRIATHKAQLKKNREAKKRAAEKKAEKEKAEYKRLKKKFE